LENARFRLQKQAKEMNLDRFTSPALLQARKEAEAYENLKIFEPYPVYDPALAYTLNQIVWWMNSAYQAQKNVAPGILPSSLEFWQSLGSKRGYYRDQTTLETLERKEYIQNQNELLGPSWRDVYLHKKDLSEAESSYLEAFPAADKPRELLAYRTIRIPNIQIKSVNLGVSPGLLVDDKDI
jgi:hypothetical protein